jgi:hypothetical protein
MQEPPEWDSEELMPKAKKPVGNGVNMLVN